MILFPFTDYWGFYLAFVSLILLFLALDLGVFRRKSHEMSFKEATIWTLIWVGLGFAFNIFFYFYARYQFLHHPRYTGMASFDPNFQAIAVGLEFFTGYLVEKTLAIDNIFIFAVVFSYFRIPKIYQHRVLFWGILGALFFRALFIAVGSYLIEYKSVVIILGLLLISTGVKMFWTGTKPQNLENSIISKLLNRFLRVHPKIEGKLFFIRKEGLTYVTPLFLAFVFLELSDIIFALDSVPAIFALTKEPLIVFTSNTFAILGLRSMYFMLAGVIDRFAYIHYGLASVLVFVGFKMVWLNDAYGGKFPIHWSLGIITALIASPIAFSIYMDRKK